MSNEAGVRLSNSAARRPVMTATKYNWARSAAAIFRYGEPTSAAAIRRVSSSSVGGRRMCRVSVSTFNLVRRRNGLAGTRSVATSQLPNAFSDVT